MDKNRWESIENIVDEALPLPADERTHFIDERCGGDQELLDAVNEMLDAIELSEGFLEDPGEQQDKLIMDFAQELEDFTPQSSMIGERLGAYRITELLGHGGMGSVFLARRVDGAFDHKVALKLVRRGMDTPQNIARFKRERTILANLNHPNIGRLYHGGLTDDGLPYLIMEYVDGLSPNEYCSKHDCSFEDRLTLFKQICRAIQHAHQNLVIHRDLKPSNILVTPEGEVKILDFGIARLLQPDDAAETIFETGTGTNVLTLAYAAPEQLSAAPVTTAADIYSLGVLLYELLADAHPFDFEDYSRTEIKDMIQHNDPLPPSEKAEQYADRLRGDLDAIIAKTLRKDPNARYNSASELVRDIERFEQQKPVTAHKGSLRYNIKKFVKRNARAFSVAAVIGMLVVGFSFFYTYNITHERNQARLEAQKAQQVTDFMIQLFDASDPENSSGDEIPVQHFLESGLSQINEMSDQPQIQSSLMMIMGEVYRKLNEYEKAKPIVKKALELKQQVHPTPHPDLADAYMIRGLLEKEIDNFATAESLYKAGIATLDKHDQQPDSLYAKLVSNLALLYEETGKFSQAIALQQQALEIQQRIYPANDGRIGIGLNHLALAQKRNGELRAAQTNYERALNILASSFGEEHPRTVTTTHNLSHLYRELGMIHKADTLMQRALRLRREIYGQDHMFVASSLNGMGHINHALGNYRQSAENFSESISILRSVYGDSTIYIGIAGTNLAGTYVRQQAFDKADSVLTVSQGIIKAGLGANNTYIGHIKLTRAEILLETGKYENAQNMYGQSKRILEENYPEDHPAMATVYRGLAKLKTSQDSLIKAKNYFDHAISILTNKVPHDHWELAQMKLEQAQVLHKFGETEEAKSLIDENISFIKVVRGLNDPLVQHSQQLLSQL